MIRLTFMLYDDAGRRLQADVAELFDAGEQER